MWVPTSRVRAVSLLFSVFALAFWLSGCGKGGGGSGGVASESASGGTGSVAVLITDAPDSEFDEINVTTTFIELLSETGRVPIFEGEETFNLLELSEVSKFFVLAEGVPAGPYGKVRMTLSDLELVRKNDQGEVIETFHPKLPGNGKLDLNPRMSFFVEAGATLLLEIDMDAKKSIHIVGTASDKYQFRPVVFVRILDSSVLGKIIRLEGTVDGAPGDDEFKLCLNGDAGLCVEVHVDADTALFDDQANPIDFGDLGDGDPVIVYARFRPDDGSPADDAENDFDVDALVIEVNGTFVALTGTASTVPMSNMFTLTLDRDQAGLTAGTDVQVELQAATRIFSKEGDVLDANDITADMMGTASGVLSSGTALKSTIIILDTTTP